MTQILSVLLFAMSSVQLTVAGNYKTVKEERSYADPPTGDWVTNGVITPMDQKMVNFYVRNADGAIEVQLQENVQIGLDISCDALIAIPLPLSSRTCPRACPVRRSRCH